MQARLSISPWKASPSWKNWSCSTVAKWWPPTPSRQRDGGVPPLAYCAASPVSGRPFLSPVGMRCHAFLLRGWRANPGRGHGAILAKCRKSSPIGGAFCYAAGCIRSGKESIVIPWDFHAINLKQALFFPSPGVFQQIPGTTREMDISNNIIYMIDHISIGPADGKSRWNHLHARRI